MSDSHAQKYHLYHSRLTDLLQVVCGCTPGFLTRLSRLGGFTPTIYADALSIRVGWLIVWGVLVTARRGDEIHSAWIIADKAQLPASAERQRQAQARVMDLRQRIEARVRASHLWVQHGYYAVPVEAFHQIAQLNEETSTAKGARHDGR